MKRSIALMLTLALLLMAPTAILESATTAPETLMQAEIEQFNHDLLERAIAEKLPPFAAEGGYVVRGANYEILLQGEDLSPDSVVLSAAITGLYSEHPEEGEQEGGGQAALPLSITGPRGSMPGMQAAELLALFPNDNEFLQGRQNSATLYVRGDLPAAVYTGFVLRNGQEVQLVEYDVYYQAGEGVARTGMMFTIEQGFLTAIRSFVNTEALSQADAQNELVKLRELREQNEYVAFGERSGSQLVREDLSLAGLDFLDSDEQAVIALLGAPVSQEKLDNSDGSTLVIDQWEGFEAVFSIRDGVNRAERLTINGGTFEGPRGLRLNDTLAQAISRFEHTGGVLSESGVLYGDALNQVPPYGLLVTGPDSTLLYYAVGLDTGKAALILEFVDDLLVNLSITYL